MHDPAKGRWWKLRIDQPASFAPKKETVLMPVVVRHVAGVAVAALCYAGVWARAESAVTAWFVAFMLSLTAGAVIAGVVGLFAKSPFWKNWVIASWVAVVLVVLGSWSK